jgi:hypothetical protein
VAALARVRFVVVRRPADEGDSPAPANGADPRTTRPGAGARHRLDPARGRGAQASPDSLH